MASYSFTFEICQADLDVLLTNDYRRSVLQVIAHTLLQHLTVTENTSFTQNDFDNLVKNILHTTSNFLEIFIAQVSREHHIAIDCYVKKIMNQRLIKNGIC